MLRFINNPKHVNKNIAMKLIEDVPPKKVHSRVVSCDGGGGPTGHPQVFINLVSNIMNFVKSILSFHFLG